MGVSSCDVKFIRDQFSIFVMEQGSKRKNFSSNLLAHGDYDGENFEYVPQLAIVIYFLYTYCTNKVLICSAVTPRVLGMNSSRAYS